jgi:hypothetical protein
MSPLFLDSSLRSERIDKVIYNSILKIFVSEGGMKPIDMNKPKTTTKLEVEKPIDKPMPFHRVMERIVLVTPQEIKLLK